MISIDNLFKDKNEVLLINNNSINFIKWINLIFNLVKDNKVYLNCHRELFNKKIL